MCYNKEISLYTYIIGLVSSYLLLNNNKPSLKILGCFFIIVIHMQLIDFFLWSNNKCNNINIKISTVGAFLNFIQPIILYLAILYYNKDIKNENKKKINIIILIYIIILFLYCMNLFPLNCSIVTQKSFPYLQWSWYYKYVPNYLLTILIILPISLFLLMYFGLDKPYNLYLSLILMLSFIISFIIYKKKKAFGNMWCWFAAFIPIIILVIDKFFISFEKYKNIKIVKHK
jgi:hypothetical protein